MRLRDFGYMYARYNLAISPLSVITNPKFFIFLSEIIDKSIIYAQNNDSLKQEVHIFGFADYSILLLSLKNFKMKFSRYENKQILE